MWQSVRSGEALAPTDVYLAPVSEQEWRIDGVTVHRLTPRDGKRIHALWRELAGVAPVVSLFGRVFAPDRHPALLAERGGEALALVSLALFEEDLVLFGFGSQLNLTRPGVGDRLLDEALVIARQAERRSVVAIVANDGVFALYFLQRSGFHFDRIVPLPQAEPGPWPTLGGILPKSELWLRREL